MVRSTAQRVADTLAALETERNCWLATSRQDGTSHLIPLTYCWDGEQLIVATRQKSVTVNAVRRTGRVRLSLPSPVDVVIVDAIASVVTTEDIDAHIDRFFRQVAGFDPAGETESYVYILLTPDRVLAWRDEEELGQREIMHSGQWIDDR